MAENRLNYIARNYDEYKKGIQEITRQYYPDVFANLNDAAIGAWFIEMLADVGDNLSYHTDRVFQETDVDSANEIGSLLNIARTNGMKVPGRKAAIVEVELSCTLPMVRPDSTGYDGKMGYDINYAPYIRRGTLFSTGSQQFELMDDVDFKEQFDINGYSNRQIIPNRSSNGNIVSYTFKKLGLAVAAESKVFKIGVQASDVKPFMTFTLADNNVVSVDSILCKKDTSMNSMPPMAEFFKDEDKWEADGVETRRFYEVENLADQYRFGYEQEALANGNSANVVVNISEELEEDKEFTVRQIMKGKWKRVKNKFVTEYGDDGRINITFGAGLENQYGEVPENAQDFNQYMMSRMQANDYMGVLPTVGDTLYILYRVGGGEISNIAQNTLTNILKMNYYIDGSCERSDDAKMKAMVKNSITVTNPSVSFGGKDAPNADEIRYLIKYNNGAQNRCVTINDYYARLAQIPAKFGLPFRYGIIEENNKIVIYTLGLTSDGKLTDALNENVATNMKEYLSMYKMVNDFIEIRSGHVINVGFTVVVYADKAYDKSEVAKRIIDLIYNYMDVHKHQMGEDIYLGDLQKEITKLDGVVQYVSMVCENKHDDNGVEYSKDITTQETIDVADCCARQEASMLGDDHNSDTSNVIDLDKSDYILFSDANAMHEIKDKNKDIKVIVKTR